MTEFATIEVDQFIAAPPSKVWRALTDPRLHARWWAPGDVRPVVGHRFHLRMPAGYGDVPCEVLEVEPESRFVYLDDPEGRKAFDGMGSGWRTHVIPRLERLVTTGD